MHTIKHAI